MAKSSSQAQSSQGEPGNILDQNLKKLTILKVAVGLGAGRGDLDQKNTASTDGRLFVIDTDTQKQK